LKLTSLEEEAKLRGISEEELRKRYKLYARV
jgi:small subunit ribosomal protein S5